MAERGKRKRSKYRKSGSKKFAYAGVGLFVFDEDDDGELSPIFIAGLCYKDIPEEAVVALESAAAGETQKITAVMQPIVDAMVQVGVQSLTMPEPGDDSDG